MLEKLKILHVEDDIDIQEIARIALELSNGFDVLQCTNAAEALARATGYDADILLLDVMMPDMTGDLLLARLRYIPGYQLIPAIFMTARAYDSEIVQLKKAGGIAVIVKPFDPMTLADQVKTAISTIAPLMQRV